MEPFLLATAIEQQVLVLGTKEVFMVKLCRVETEHSGTVGRWNWAVRSSRSSSATWEGGAQFGVHETLISENKKKNKAGVFLPLLNNVSSHFYRRHRLSGPPGPSPEYRFSEENLPTSRVRTLNLLREGSLSSCCLSHDL